MHKMQSENNFWYKCLKPNCQTTFKQLLLLDFHMRIHNNELDNCQYCPYRYVKTPDYRDHLNKHFRIKDYKCENCGLTFMTRKALAEHSSTHEGIVYCCLICETYQIGSRQANNKQNEQIETVLFKIRSYTLVTPPQPISRLISKKIDDNPKDVVFALVHGVKFICGVQ